MRVTAPTAYPQLDEEALRLLQARLEFHGGSRAALARELGVSRSGVSQALDGKYPGDTKKLRALIVETLAQQIACPHLGHDIAPQACRLFRERPLSAASAAPADVKHWQACQLCMNNPARRAVVRGDASDGEAA